MELLDSIVFWILMVVIIGVSIWLAFGSPDFQNSLLMVVLFFAGSEILLWRNLFVRDKKVAVGFERVKLDFEKVRSDFRVMDGRLAGIEKSVGEIRDILREG